LEWVSDESPIRLTAEKGQVQLLWRQVLELGNEDRTVVPLYEASYLGDLQGALRMPQNVLVVKKIALGALPLDSDGGVHAACLYSPRPPPVFSSSRVAKNSAKCLPLSTFWNHCFLFATTPTMSRALLNSVPASAAQVHAITAEGRGAPVDFATEWRRLRGAVDQLLAKGTT
jgi:hypothetical protein